jgi:hypothetical protein
VLLTTLEFQWAPAAGGSQLMILVLAFVVPLEALAGLFAFLARDSGAATSHASSWAASATWRGAHSTASY